MLCHPVSGGSVIILQPTCLAPDRHAVSLCNWGAPSWHLWSPALLRAPTGLGFRFLFSSLQLPKATLQPHSLLNLGQLCRQAECDASSQDLLLFLDVLRQTKILSRINITRSSVTCRRPTAASILMELWITPNLRNRLPVLLRTNLLNDLRERFSPLIKTTNLDILPLLYTLTILPRVSSIQPIPVAARSKA